MLSASRRKLDMQWQREPRQVFYLLRQTESRPLLPASLNRADTRRARGAAALSLALLPLLPSAVGHVFFTDRTEKGAPDLSAQIKFSSCYSFNPLKFACRSRLQ